MLVQWTEGEQTLDRAEKLGNLNIHFALPAVDTFRLPFMWDCVSKVQPDPLVHSRSTQCTGHERSLASSCGGCVGSHLRLLPPDCATTGWDIVLYWAEGRLAFYTYNV